MATEQFRGNGAFSVNEGYATSVRYVVHTDDRGAPVGVDLRFMNGRSEIASAQLAVQDAREVLGERNYEAVVQGQRAYVAAMKANDEAGPGRGERVPERELRGRNLEFRQVMLPGYAPAAEENAIHLDSRVRAREQGEQGGERLTTRDAVVGAAHTAQAAGIGGAAVQGAAAAVGVADAAKLAADAVDGKPVRPLDAATAAATVTATAGLGGPAVQGAAKVTQAIGAADTAKRAAASLDDATARPGDNRQASDAQEQARLQQARAHAVPDGVAERFLKVDDKYYFPDKKLAFVDRGTKLKAETNNLEVVRSIVSIAETRGWEALTVTGAKDFRREVWREASLRGIDVRGYEPSDLERQELQRALEKRHGPNEIQREGRQQAPNAPARDVDVPRAASPASPPRAESPDSPAAEARAAEGAKLLAKAAGITASAMNADDQAAARRELTQAQQLTDKAYRQLAAVSADRAQALVQAEHAKLADDPTTQHGVRFDMARYVQAGVANARNAETAPSTEPRAAVLSGRLIESGHAPYKFDPKEKDSYFVKVQTDKGERTVWGVDLERALAESRTGVKPGDQVMIENQGSKPVTVTVPVRDAAGQVVGEKELKTHRNAWVVEKPSYFDERAEKAAAFRNGDRAKQELATQYPDLTNAIATMRLGELFAEKLIDRPEDRRRVVASLRETLADAIERGETIQAPKIKEATVRKLDKITGEIDEVAQRTAAEKAVKGAREVGARAKGREDMQHVRA